MKKSCVFSGIILCFLIGAYSWNLLNTNYRLSRNLDHVTKNSVKNRKTLIEVEGVPITKKDVQFEYDLLTKDLDDKLLKSSSDLESNPRDAALIPLRENIINSLVERKMLYQFVRDDKYFDLSKSDRYSQCLRDCEKITKANIELFSNIQNKERLKSRLCEESILKQYVEERIFSKIEIADSQLNEFYQSHKDILKIPAKVSIRQIVLAEEREARLVRSKVTRANFIELAKEYSITPEAASGGELQPFSKTSGLPRFFDVAFSMRKGQISSILKSTYGFHIIMLKKKVKARELSFEQALPLLRKALVDIEKEKVYQKWVDLALHSIKISTPPRLL